MYRAHCAENRADVIPAPGQWVLLERVFVMNPGSSIPAFELDARS